MNIFCKESLKYFCVGIEMHTIKYAEKIKFKYFEKQ